MIDDKAKQKLIDEIQKLGNVFWSCQKVGINRATYYRWKKEDEEFEKMADEAEMMGRGNFCDIAKFSLAQNVKDKNQRAIEYTLNHLSPEFKEKQTTNVVFMHKKEMPLQIKQKTLEDFIDDDEALLNENIQREIVRIKNLYKPGIPPKSDGSKISDEELIKYEGYIEDWYLKKGKMLKQSEGNTIIFRRMDGKPDEDFIVSTEDSKSEMDKQLTTPAENQKPSDSPNSNSAMLDRPPDSNI